MGNFGMACGRMEYPAVVWNGFWQFGMPYSNMERPTAAWKGA